MPRFTEEALRAEFKELALQHKALAEQAKPHREAYDKLSPKLDKVKADMKACAEKFLPIEAQMSELSNSMAMLARALKGKTGDPLEVPVPPAVEPGEMPAQA